MNKIERYLTQLAGLDAAPEQRAFFEAQRDAAQAVQCVPMSEVFGVAAWMHYLTELHPEKKMCYKNASEMVELGPAEGLGVPPFKYVEGFICPPGLFPIEHAFVRVGDAYVDPTFELALKQDVTACEYVSLLELDWEELCALQLETGYYGDMFRHLYCKRLKGYAGGR